MYCGRRHFQASKFFFQQMLHFIGPSGAQESKDSVRHQIYFKLTYPFQWVIHIPNLIFYVCLRELLLKYFFLQNLLSFSRSTNQAVPSRELCEPARWPHRSVSGKREAGRCRQVHRDDLQSPGRHHRQCQGGSGTERKEAVLLCRPAADYRRGGLPRQTGSSLCWTPSSYYQMVTILSISTFLCKYRTRLPTNQLLPNA